MKFGFNGALIGQDAITEGGSSGMHDSASHYDRSLSESWPINFGEPQGENISTLPYSPTINTFTESSSSDSTQAFDTYDIQVDTSLGGGASGRIYIGCNVTATTTYYNDLCIGGVQILDASKSSLLNSYIFSSSTTGWETSQAQSPIASYNTAELASALSFTTALGAATTKWGPATSTGSSYTGAADGISTAYTTSIMPGPGNFQVSQQSNTNYLYRETSGSTLNTIVWLRSPLISVSPGSVIRVAAHSSTNSSGGMQPDGTLYIGWY